MNDDTPAARTGLVRMWAAAALVTLPLIIIGWSLLVSWNSLPDDLPTQWSGKVVVSWVPTLWFAVVVVLIAGVAAAFAWQAAVSRHSYQRHDRVFLISGSIAAVAATAWLISATVVHDHDHEIGIAILFAFAAMLYGLIPFAIGRTDFPMTGEPQPTGLDAEPTGTVAWSQTQVAPIFVWATVASGVVAIAFGFVPMILIGIQVTNSSIAIVAPILTVIFFATMRVHVTVDQRGLRARSATVGVRLVSVRLEAISSASVTILEPLRWGGWGYRVGPRGKALVLRSGPAIVVTLPNGADVAVTTPDAEQAVSVLQALKHRQGDSN
ncbi:hypothetical protein G3T36_05270 [Diaminobutyricibacter tongyongensis]|uniref:DUF1648 domain-containing protein n=1 Tax=Leifsonia tongyongensis TaxID=1268043 RepID=A0A6L9XVF2_9MICO|nr:hypothetical protein [Diaminobutyricibacter tongyongensis]NEN05276.1 hypothetical protein [Diaminobutyricibacter tongyongensis]